MQWREQWLTPCMHGARKKHEIYDVSWSLGLHIEHETLCERFLSGVSMDRKKFFDLLQYEVGYFILGALGAPSGVLVAAQNFYQNLQCMKATTDYFFTKKHGFAQVNSFSLQVALAYIMAWTKYMKCDPCLDHVITTGSFMDDSHFFCSCDLPVEAARAIAQSWRRSLEFDSITGLVTNVNKSFFFVNHESMIGPIQACMIEFSAENRLKCKKSFVLVGSVVTSMGGADLSQRNQRVAAAIEKPHKIRFAPLRFAHRVKMAAAIFPAAIFGCEQVLLTKGLYETLRGAVVYLLWKGKTWLRCWATTATHILPVHRLHPVAAVMYNVLTLLSRLLQRREDLRLLVRFDMFGNQITLGPLAVVQSIIDQLNVTRVSAFVFQSQEVISFI